MLVIMENCIRKDLIGVQCLQLSCDNTIKNKCCTPCLVFHLSIASVDIDFWTVVPAQYEFFFILVILATSSSSCETV
ncbi:hypothetical protein VNO80_13641 [Phaseolus coccineus]|uniref:Uncharacterized protein n=1 Tax=Phaseolus coccineus TaxID=3886 RepID=A0AAN9R775_PHACN